jgi:ATP-binding cassette subfamily C protein
MSDAAARNADGALEILRRVAAVLRFVKIKGVALVLAAVTTSALLEFAGVSLIYVIGKIMLGGSKAAGHVGNSRILEAAVLVAVLYLVKNIAVVVLGIFTQEKVWSWFVQLSDAISRRYLLANYANVISLGSADVNTSLRCASTVVVQLSLTARAAADILVILLLTALLVSFDPILGPALLGAGILGLVGVIIPLRGRFRRWGVLHTDAEHRMNLSSFEAFGSLQDMRIFGGYGFMQRRLSSAAVDLARAVGKSEGIADIPRASTETALMGVFAIGAVAVAMSGRTLANLVPFGAALFAAMMRILPSLNRIATCYTLWLRTEAPVNVVYRVLFDPALDPEVGTERAIACRFNSELALRNVVFTYPGQDKAGVSDASLVIRRGECVGLAGASGSGKTTLTGILLGLFKPQNGTILVDGVSIHDDLNAWRANTALVAQTPFLLDGSIASNIALGIDEKDIDHRRLAEAVRQASLDRFVATLPEGLNTRVGERGVLLSGGERQRIAIGRALYFGRQFIVLDEATSALDPLTEREIVSSLEGLRGQVTIIIIAHRLTTLRTCDRILVLDKGHVIQEGTYGDLTMREGQFREMAQRMGAS